MCQQLGIQQETVPGIATAFGGGIGGAGSVLALIERCGTAARVVYYTQVSPTVLRKGGYGEAKFWLEPGIELAQNV